MRASNNVEHCLLENFDNTRLRMLPNKESRVCPVADSTNSEKRQLLYKMSRWPKTLAR